MSTEEWRELKNREVFESTLVGLERRRAADPDFRLEDAEGTLTHLYVQEGNDWAGRGPLQDLVLEATIAAYERFIAAWRESRPAAGSSSAAKPPHEE